MPRAELVPALPTRQGSTGYEGRKCVASTFFRSVSSLIAPRSRPGSPGGARPDARRLPATGLGWRRRNGPATGPRPASATALASSRRCSPAARRPRPAHRKSRLCLRGRTARCTPPGAGNCPAGILISTGRQQRLLIEDRHALEPALEERAAGLLLAVGQP